MNTTYHALESPVLFVVVLCLYLESEPSLQKNVYRVIIE